MLAHAKLEPHADAIASLRAAGATLQTIVDHLKAHCGVTTSTASVSRFIKTLPETPEALESGKIGASAQGPREGPPEAPPALGVAALQARVESLEKAQRALSERLQESTAAGLTARQAAAGDLEDLRRRIDTLEANRSEATGRPTRGSAMPDATLEPDPASPTVEDTVSAVDRLLLGQAVPLESTQLGRPNRLPPWQVWLVRFLWLIAIGLTVGILLSPFLA